MNETNPNWEREVLEKLVLTTLKEQRKSRNWGIFFKFVGFAYLFLVLGLLVAWIGGGDDEGAHKGPHTAVVELHGVVAGGGEASAERVIEGLRNAFKDKNTKGVVIRINSPGGSPVQSGQINDEIKRLRKQYPNIPLYAVVEDICASGAYYVAVAADRIYVDKASLVGSIGVIMDRFGFTGTMEKLGVERRVLTAGSNKAFLDPFSPENPAQVDYAKAMLGEIHEQFIKTVRDGRGKRLKETPDMFSGLVWSGERAIEIGLADAIGSTDQVAREVIHADQIVNFTAKEHWSERFARSVGTSMASRVGTLFEPTLR